VAGQHEEHAPDDGQSDHIVGRAELVAQFLIQHQRQQRHDEAEGECQEEIRLALRGLGHATKGFLGALRRRVM
jgi:hypothetical protein